MVLPELEHTLQNHIFILLNIAREQVRSRFSRVRLFATPWSVACQAPLSMGFSRQEYWSAFPCPPPGNLPDPGIEPWSPVSSASLVDPLLLNHQGTNTCNWKLSLCLVTWCMVEPEYGLKFILWVHGLTAGRTQSGSQALAPALCVTIVSCQGFVKPLFSSLNWRGKIIPTIWSLGIACSISGRCLQTALKFRMTSTV